MRIILCGFGVVGQSLVALLDSRADELYSQYGLKNRLVGVFDSGGGATDTMGLNLKNLLEDKKNKGTITQGKEQGTSMIENISADVLIETTPSNYKDAQPGLSHITTALKKKMHVISVNKGPLALAFPSLLELALYNHVLFKFSGTVGGGTPILDYAKNSLQGESIESFDGILNGTTNYILSNMREGMSPEDAIQDARGKGYMEADESLDLDGLDAAAKLVIMANWIMGTKATLHDVDCTGIKSITQEQVDSAKKSKKAIKLIASCNGGLRVSPKELDIDDPLCVNGTLNAVSFTSSHSGTQTIIGRGAGGTETASAILRDLIDIKKEMTR